ncbi:MAG: PEP-utilizing enzyme [Candidatus Diapherotrites archaeon]
MNLTKSQETILKKAGWDKYAVRPYPFFLWSFILKGYHSYELFLKNKFDYLMIYDAAFEKIFYRQASKRREMQEFIRKKLDNIKYWEKYVEKENKALNNTFKNFNSLVKKDFNKMNEKQLLNEFKSFYFDNIPWLGALSSTILVIPELVEKLQKETVLPRLVKQGKEKELTEVMGLFSQSLGLSFYIEEETELLELALKRKSKNFNALLERHVKKWDKMAFGGSHKLLAKEQFMQRINESKNPLKELNEKKQKKIHAEKEIQKLIKMLEFSEKEKRLLVTIRKFLYQRTREDCLISVQEFIFMKFFREIAKRNHDISLSQAEKMTIDETISVLSGKKINEHELNERKKACLIVQFKEKQIVVSGEKAEKLHKKIIKDVAPKKFSGILQGQTGHPGKATGKARLIQHITHLDELKPEEILVTTSTNPSFVIAMKKAKAIITDEGGITSHAAIVARELKKPCIVGTKYAMQFLKTGDLIEVNATEGIVKKIRK